MASLVLEGRSRRFIHLMGGLLAVLKQYDIVRLSGQLAQIYI